MKQIEALLTDIESKIEKHHLLQSSVSEANVGWHIKHSLLVLDSVIEAMKKSEPAKYKWSFKIPRFIVFGINRIPRGKGKSPKMVRPETYDEASLRTDLEVTQKKITDLKTLENDKYFRHPYFGDLKKKQALKFLMIHTKHHMAIADDIIKAENK
ncbi:hypothetical protein [Flammeovirga aprica]|uniref:DUF1569 domain-containing protein n=1 Tax=Flammeovirga aprica JL-4 TaxID=694437 RepID=A0A7X9XCF2_9BACT|nr:hypothetical protein [Flammeovirga aprica]NME71665.1 hypothetical protein [Flammeovirga aprica JL-4]